MLAEVVSGSIEPPHIVSPIRSLLSHTNFYHADIQAIEVINRRVVINYHDSDNHRALFYDHLVIAVGSSVEETILPGVSEHTTVATLGPGEYFGEMALLQERRHTASARALTHVHVLVMNGASTSQPWATSPTRFSELLAGVMKQHQAENEAADPQ